LYSTLSAPLQLCICSLSLSLRSELIWVSVIRLIIFCWRINNTALLVGNPPFPPCIVFYLYYAIQNHNLQWVCRKSIVSFFLNRTDADSTGTGRSFAEYKYQKKSSHKTAFWQCVRTSIYWQNFIVDYYSRVQARLVLALRRQEED
jgi:hypothetical protein